MMKSKEFLIGLDLGGTKLAWTLISTQGREEFFKSEPLNISHIDDPKKSQRQVISLMAKAVRECVEYVQKNKMGRVVGLGLASAGPMNIEKGELIAPSNFKGWQKVAIVKLLKKELLKSKIKLAIAFQNDAMAASLGEGWLGAAKGLKSFAVVTVGTGIGTGVIFKGEPLQYKGMGGEWGLQIVDVSNIKINSDPFHQCVEGIASGTALLRRAQEMGFQGKSTFDLVQEIKSGQAQYQKLFIDAARALAVLCFNLSLGFNLEKILFSGGIIQVKEFFWDVLLEEYERLISRRHQAFRAKIKIAKLDIKAGAIGAAYLGRA